MNEYTKNTMIVWVLLLGMLANVSVAGAAVWYVDDDCTSSPGTGTEADPFCLIQLAIETASGGDTVIVLSGTYNESVNLQGKAIYLLGLGSPSLNGDFDSGIICTSGEGADTIIEGFRIEFGYGHSTGVDETRGGGAFISNSSPTVRNCVFDRNVAYSDTGIGKGNGIALVNSSSLIEGCFFTNNSNAGWETYGGGIHCDASSPVVVDCTFYLNGGYAGTVWGEGIVRGGAMYNENGSDVYIENCNFISNYSLERGAGIFNAGSTCTVVGSIFNYNQTLDADGGGGMANLNSTVTVVNCTFVENAGTPGAQGPSILNVGGHRDVTNTICTVGIAGGEYGEIYDIGTVTGEVTYSSIEGGFAGTGNIDASIIWSSTVGDDLAYGTLDDTFALRPGSQCVDAGNNTALLSLTSNYYTLDIEGNVRFADVPGVVDTGVGTDTIVDIGATEVRCADIIVPDDAPTIQAAIDLWNELNYCGGIMVRPGTYAEHINLLGKPIRLYAENPAALLDASDVLDPTLASIIDGEEATTMGPVVTMSTEETEATVLEGFTITRGNGGYGGGLRIGEPFVVMPINPTILDCVLIENHPNTEGGAVFNDGNSTFTNCHFINNSVWQGSGGAIKHSGRPKFIDCLFSGNVASGSGGALYCVTPAYLENCLFINNSAATAGALDMPSGFSETVINNCQFVGNEAGDGGAIRGAGGGAPPITNCQFIGNTALGVGGAIFVHGGFSPKLTNCLFSGNNAPTTGAGIYMHGGNFILENCTFSGNSTTGSVGGAVYVQSGSLTVANTIMWGNGTTPLGGDPFLPVQDVTYSNIEGGYAGTGNIGELAEHDPGFLDPAGPDLTYGTEDDDVRLAGWSPSIDAGDNTLAESIPFDIMGLPRFVDIPFVADTGVAGSGHVQIVDMGAHEADPSAIYTPGYDYIGLYSDPEGAMRYGGATPGVEFTLYLVIFPYEAPDEILQVTGWECSVPTPDGATLVSTVIHNEDPGTNLHTPPSYGPRLAPYFTYNPPTVLAEYTFTVPDSDPRAFYVTESNPPSGSPKLAYTSFPDKALVHLTPASGSEGWPVFVLNDGVSPVEESELPRSYNLEACHPNPFNPNTIIAFSLASSRLVHLSIYDLKGRLVRSMISGYMAAGRHEVVWRGKDQRGAGVASGVYFARIVAGNFTQTRPMTLVK